MKINTKQAIQIMCRFNDYIQEHELALNEWDQAGDGDHGTHMSHAMRMVLKQLDRQNFALPHEVFSKSAAVIQANGEGIACYYYAKAFAAMAECEDEFCLGDALAHALEALEQESDASFLDKTMLDVWRGVLELYETEQFEKDLIRAIPHRTKEMIAKKGQAAQNPQQSANLFDPGSMSSMYLMLSFHDVLYA
ncbi:MAG TPA: DAK2 domain-containing protein [Erysipelothrix sp.]